MNAEQRSPYVALAAEILWPVCAFCRFRGGDCEDATCKHGLDAVTVNYEFNNGDVPHCWAFRPKRGLDVSTVADIVGKVLDSGHRLDSYSLSDAGRVSVYSSEDV